MKFLTKSIISLSILLAFGLLTVACDQQANPLDSTQSDIRNVAFQKPGNDYSYPQSGEQTYNYWGARDIYRGGSLMMPNGSVFNLTAGSLTPPSSIPWGQDVNITLTVDKDEIKNELIFTFGPSGAQFYPAAKVYLNYKDLNIEVPTFYYIDNNGNYIEQTPEDIDVTNRNIILYIDHFSRYAIGTE